MSLDPEPIQQNLISAYTDGSCNTSTLFGAWAAIILIGNEKIILEGHANQTTHQRMELTAVIEALAFIEKSMDSLPIIIYTDSQYVKDLQNRKEKLLSSAFITKKKTELANVDLIKRIFSLCEKSNVTFVKVKSHAKTSSVENFNREADMLCRKIVRSGNLK